METAARRLQHLIEDLIAEARPKAGAQTKIAARLGIGEAVLSRAKRGTKSDVESKTLEAVCRALRLDPAYFFAQPEIDRLSYLDFLRSEPAKQPLEPAHWREFAAKWHRFAELTPQERDLLKRMSTHDRRVHDWTDYLLPAAWLLDHRV